MVRYRGYVLSDRWRGVSHLASVEDAVDVLEEGLFDDLSVVDHEDLGEGGRGIGVRGWRREG